MHALPSPVVVARMLPSTTMRALPIHRAYLAPGLASSAKRSFSSSGPRLNVNSLKGQKTDEKSSLGPGAESLHISECITFSFVDGLAVSDT